MCYSDALALALSLISNVTNNSINYRPMSPLMTLNSHYNQIFDLVMFGAKAMMFNGINDLIATKAQTYFQ